MECIDIVVECYLEFSTCLVLLSDLCIDELAIFFFLFNCIPYMSVTGEA